MQSNPRTIEEPVPMVENSVGDSPPSQSHLQDLLLHASEIAVSWRETQKTSYMKEEKADNPNAFSASKQLWSVTDVFSHLLSADAGKRCSDRWKGIKMKPDRQQ